MTEPSAKALLPAGLSDVLPPEAEHEEAAVRSLMTVLSAHGYDRVKPPLIEFEDSLLSGSGAALARQTFRMMDPISQRMMGVRPDMTMQVARIAATRLLKTPRPLRLSYAGQVLRVSGTQLRPERQFGQVGAELIGSSSHRADVEVILMAVEALQAAGIVRLTIDLALPTLVPTLCAALSVDEQARSRLLAALDRKDAVAVAEQSRRLGAEAGALFPRLLAASGPAARALQALVAIDLPPTAAAEREALVRIADDVRKGLPDVPLTIDPVERRGWEYHTGVTFTLFAPGVRGELGSGGRYRAYASNGGEDATGLTLFMDTVMRARPPAKPPNRLYLPLGTSLLDGRHLRELGWTTVSGLETTEALGDAQRLECSHALVNGKTVAVRPTDGE